MHKLTNKISCEFQGFSCSLYNNVYTWGLQLAHYIYSVSGNKLFPLMLFRKIVIFCQMQ